MLQPHDVVAQLSVVVVMMVSYNVSACVVMPGGGSADGDCSTQRSPLCMALRQWRNLAGLPASTPHVRAPGSAVSAPAVQLPLPSMALSNSWIATVQCTITLALPSGCQQLYLNAACYTGLVPILVRAVWNIPGVSKGIALPMPVVF